MSFTSQAIIAYVLCMIWSFIHQNEWALYNNRYLCECPFIFLVLSSKYRMPLTKHVFIFFLNAYMYLRLSFCHFLPANPAVDKLCNLTCSHNARKHIHILSSEKKKQRLHSKCKRFDLLVTL